MSDQFWFGLGLGTLLGAILFDQLWRHVNRMRDRLDELRAEPDSGLLVGLDEALGLHDAGYGYPGMPEST